MDWPKPDLKRLSDQLVKVSSLEQHGESLLVALGETNFELLMDLFYQRMLEKQKNVGRFKLGNYYQAIPSYAYELKPIFQKNEGLAKSIIKEWSKKHMSEVSVFSINFSDFINTFAPTIQEEIITELVSSGKQKDLKEAANMISGIKNLDLKFCMKISEMTDDKDILNTLKHGLTDVGVLSGNPGENLFGKAWQGKANEITGSAILAKNKKSQSFLKETIDYLNLLVQDSEKKHQAELERKRLRMKEDEE